MSELLRSIAGDLRAAVRVLRRDLRLTTFAVLSVGLGVGATVTVFSVVDALLLRPLPFRDARRLVWISNGDRYDLSERTAQVQYVWALRRDSRALVDVAGYSEFYGVGDHSLTSGAGEPERITGVRVTRNFFALLGVQPLVGRQFTEEEAQDGSAKVVLLSHRLWTRRLASDPHIVGRALTIDGAPATVVGVLPPSFDFGTIFAPGRRVDFYSPFPLTEATNRRGNELALIGRLRPGATVDGAQREATLIAERARIEGEARRRTNAFAPLVRPLRDHVSGTLRQALLVLTGGVGLVMLLVCANLSNLLLTRATTRERELALRLALGAGRGRLVRQLLTESLALAAAGAALGVLLAVVGTRVLAHAPSLRLPLLDHVHVDATALLFALGAAVFTGLVFGVTPALRVSGVAVDEALKDAARGSSAGVRHEWTRSTLVVTEVALACALLVGAGLLTRSFVRVLDQDLGFRPERVVAMRIDPSRAFASQALRTAYYDEVLRAVRDAPGVDAAGLTDVLPMGFNRIWTIATERQAPPERLFQTYVRVVSDGYMRAMGVPLRAGRDFAASDDSAGPPVVIVSTALARRLWPVGNPLGRTLVVSGTPVTVVGVVDGLRYQAVEQEAGSDLYLPMRQTPDYDAVHVVARGTRPPTQFIAALRAALRPIDPTLPLTEVRTMQGIVDESVSPRRLVATLLAGFAVFALALASLGIYAVVSYGVTQRRREFGIRMALGASPHHLRSRVLGGTLRLATAGLCVGLLASWPLGRVLRGLLFGVTSTDPSTLSVTLAVLLIVAALAAYFPARRASRQNPAHVLRAD